MQVEGTRMLRVKAVAEQFDVDRSTVYRAIQAGALFAVRLGRSKGLRVPEPAVSAWIKSRAATGTVASATASNESGDVTGGER